jgi:hypothetical protein
MPKAALAAVPDAEVLVVPGIAAYLANLCRAGAS